MLFALPSLLPWSGKSVPVSAFCSRCREKGRLTLFLKCVLRVSSQAREQTEATAVGGMVTSSRVWPAAGPSTWSQGWGPHLMESSGSPSLVWVRRSVP